MVRDLEYSVSGALRRVFHDDGIYAGRRSDGGRRLLPQRTRGGFSHFSTAGTSVPPSAEHGNQRDLTAQWTATASGAVVISSERKSHICLTHATIGRIVDPGITDSNCMGARWLQQLSIRFEIIWRDLGRTPKDYDLILTGIWVMWAVWRILVDFIWVVARWIQAAELKSVYDDRGSMDFRIRQNRMFTWGSGCGCSGSIIAGRICRQMEEGKIRRAMLISTGALMSTISSQQGESIPASLMR